MPDDATGAAGGLAGAPVLEVREISKFYGHIRALDGVTFEIRPGEVVGLVGDNGAGTPTSRTSSPAPSGLPPARSGWGAKEVARGAGTESDRVARHERCTGVDDARFRLLELAFVILWSLPPGGWSMIRAWRADEVLA